MQLAGQSCSLELLRLDDAADGVLADSLRQVDCDRGPRPERLRQAQVVLAEHRGRPVLVVRDHDSDRSSAHYQRHVERRMDTQAPSRLLVDLRIVEQRVDPLAPAAVEHASRFRPGDRELHPRDAEGALSLGRRHPQHVALREGDQNELCVDELLQPAGDQGKQGLQLELRRERVSDLVQRLELAQPPGRALVETGVLDRDGGLGREQLGQLGVLVREVLSTCLLREVEVPVRDAAQHDRHAQERLHRRVIRWEADGARIVRDVVQPQRVCVTDQDAQNAAPMWQLPDRGMRGGVDARRQEPFERLARPVDDAERRVARAGDLGRRLDDALQQRIERELRAERDPGVDENAQTVELVCLGAHGRHSRPPPIPRTGRTFPHGAQGRSGCRGSSTGRSFEATREDVMSLIATARSVAGTLRQEVLVDGHHRLTTDQPERLGGEALRPHRTSSFRLRSRRACRRPRDVRAHQGLGSR